MIMKDDRIKLIDFGTAKLATRTITYTSSAIGTTFYMAPDYYDFDDETESEKPVGHSTAVDVWSLGVILTEIISGVFPYSHVTRNETVIESMLIKRKKFPIPHEIKKDFHEFLPIIERCLELDRHKRCTSEDAMIFLKGYLPREITESQEQKEGTNSQQ